MTTWTAKQYLSSVPAEISVIAESGGIAKWALDECAFADAEIQGGAEALSEVAAEQLQEQIDYLNREEDSPLVSVGIALIEKYRSDKFGATA
ncbi:hypothetical protein [Aeromonas jandaei]|uniref:hypothetical protein n=1 Tax=Aeromonas jandaei TaxID=650 RepID=UPI003BA2D505